MNKQFTINNKKYNVLPFSFNTMCDLEDMGTPLQMAGKAPTSTLRAYFALCAGIDKDEAGYEIQQHILNGGTLEELSDVFGDELDKSDFFQALNENEETKTSTSKTTESKKK